MKATITIILLLFCILFSLYMTNVSSQEEDEYEETTTEAPKEKITKKQVFTSKLYKYNDKCADPILQYKFKIEEEGFFLGACCEKDVFTENNCAKSTKKKRPGWDGPISGKCKGKLLLKGNCCLVSNSNCFYDLNKNGKLPCCRQIAANTSIPPQQQEQKYLCNPPPGALASPDIDLFCKAPHSGDLTTDVLKFQHEDLKTVQSKFQKKEQSRTNYTAGLLHPFTCCQNTGNKVYHIGHFFVEARNQELCCDYPNATYASLNQIKHRCCLMPLWTGNDSMAFNQNIMCAAGIKCCDQRQRCPFCGGNDKTPEGPYVQEDNWDKYLLAGAWTHTCGEHKNFHWRINDWVNIRKERVYNRLAVGHDKPAMAARCKQYKKECSNCTDPYDCRV